VAGSRVMPCPPPTTHEYSGKKRIMWPRASSAARTSTGMRASTSTVRSVRT